ncbi:MAG: DUF1292 domain-containing protein [Clostridiales bacterium]|nr:DUF1292 domain-containing protein [Clostridiales bacterium]
MPEEKKPEYEGALLTLEGEDGQEEIFEHLDTLEYEGALYFALMPVHDAAEDYLDADGELVFMKVYEEDGEEMLCGLEPGDEAFEEVRARFVERLSEEFEIIEDDEEL